MKTITHNISANTHSPFLTGLTPALAYGPPRPDQLCDGGWPGISIADLPAPGAWCGHPQAALAQAVVKEFARRFELMPPTFEAYNTMFTAVYPTAPFARLVTIGKVFCLFFYLDDVVLDVAGSPENGDGGAAGPSASLSLALIGKGLKIFQTGQIGSSQPSLFEQAVKEVREELLAQSNHEWLCRFARTVANYLETSREISQSARVGCAGMAQLDTLEDYLSWRELDSGTYTGMDLIEFAQDNYLPPALFDQTPLRDLRELTGWIWAGLNDLASFHKELALNRPSSNLVNWFMTKHALGLAEAVAEVVSLLHAQVKAFKLLVDHLPAYAYGATTMASMTAAGSDAGEDEGVAMETAMAMEVAGGDDLRRYVSGLSDLLWAGWHWQLHTPRYRSPNSLFKELR